MLHLFFLYLILILFLFLLLFIPSKLLFIIFPFFSSHSLFFSLLNFNPSVTSSSIFVISPDFSPVFFISILYSISPLRFFKFFTVWFTLFNFPYSYSISFPLLFNFILLIYFFTSISYGFIFFTIMFSVIPPITSTSFTSFNS